ncbi:UNVERIFIED_CONTAM: hypothetical protein GTU68_066771 [Idotea baltica]|nr:hypothetical protein [Idotea baltica]
MKQIAYVTGATAGFGEAIAYLLGQNNYDLILTGRRKEKLKLVADKCRELGAEVLEQVYDIQNRKDVEKSVNMLATQWQSIDLLVNNAGLAVGLDPFQEAQVDDWERMIDTNVKGLLYLSKAIVPLMIANKKGHIINIASTAGSQVYARGNVYCATKHAVKALTKAMRIDLLPNKIRVSSVSPGAAETEFSVIRFKGDVDKAKAAYAGYEPMVAQDIAECVLFVATRPPHVCINDIELTPTAQADSFNWFKE